MGVPFSSPIDLQNNEIQNAIIHSLPSNPVEVEGKVYYNSTTKKYMGYNGTSWIELGSVSLNGGDIVESSGIPLVVHVTESSKVFEYNVDGLLSKITDSYGTRTFNYTNGVLSSIVGTGKYQSKSIITVNDKVTNINIVS